MCEHELLAQIAILKAELTKREEQVKELQKENELLRAEQTCAAREKKSCNATTASILNEKKMSNGDWSEEILASKGDQFEQGAT